MDDTRYKALSEIKKLNKKKGIVAPWQMAPLKGISFKLSRDKADEKLVSQLQNECDNVKYYHLIKITQIGPYDRLYILKSILDFVYPSELIPCHYFQCATEVRFLARRCTEALLKIVNNNFLIPHYPTNSSGVGTEATFEAAIVCNFCAASLVEINRSENILEVLKARFDSETGVLDLSNFAADKRLIEYCPLFQPRMLLYIMYLSNKLTYVKTINLKNNCIKHITCLDVLKYTKVETIDLTYNQIKNIEDIKGIADAGCLRNLKLEHNPLCSNYENYNYVIDVKTLIPNLETLDDVDVTTPSFKKNFVCSPDGQGLAQQFLTHFFTIYDSGNREDLEDFYENNAFFSVNVHVIPFQKNSYSVRLSHYGLKHPFTVQSSEEIMKVFKSFPRTQHDIYTFVCDLLIYTPQYAVLTVGGIFKELNQILGFSRTFVLIYYKGSYTIANDQMSVFNATDYQLEWSFSFPSKVEYFGNPLPYYPEQYEAVGELTQKLCRMNVEYSKVLLEYCDYDVSKALYLFSELYQKNLLPDKAFQQQKGQKDDDDKKKAKYTFFSSILEKSLEDPSKASVKTLWSAVRTSRLQRCEDKVPNAPTNIIKIPRSTKPSNLDRYSPTLDDDEDDDSNVAASSTSHITNQTIHHVLNHINSNATVSCDASSDSQAVGMPSIQPVASRIKISVRGDLFSTQSRDPYGISQRIQEIVNAKASPLSNLNNTCSISKCAEEITSSKSVNSDIQSLTVGDQPILQAGSTSTVPPNMIVNLALTLPSRAMMYQRLTITQIELLKLVLPSVIPP
ncbi:unnamed protein product [Callosobruchus maculatus]|uniref:Uncharacterized protein n=1 Tax=Callosobruchus maculatus TaxID=64391 RepID=A0A653CCV9_CALMS|nr:unnamed protein product [Callosobruchus maculatus]